MNEQNSPETRTLAALSRLEQALEPVFEKATHAGDNGEMRERMDALRAERDDLAARLHEAESRGQSLKKTSDRVAERLDATIDQLKLVLEG